MKRRLLVALAFCSACAARHTSVVVDYRRAEPLDEVAVVSENHTGQELSMPPGGVIEQAVRIITQQPAAEPTITDAFLRAAAARLGERNVRVSVPNATAARRLRVALMGWDVQNDGAAGAVVFVSAAYQLLDTHAGVLWEVQQDRLPMRLSGPNLSGYEVERVARRCVDVALASLLQ